MYITVVDLKVWNSATGTSFTMRCYFYKIAIKGFNNLDKMLICEMDPSISSETEKLECSENEDEL